MPWSMGRTLPSQGCCMNFSSSTPRPVSWWRAGENREISSRENKKPPPPPACNLLSYMYNPLWGENKTKQKNQTMDTWLKSLLKMQMQSFGVVVVVPTLPNIIPNNTPLGLYSPPSNIPKPSTQALPYPLHSQLTSEPTSFRKPSPIKEARVRTPSSPRHHQTSKPPPPYSGSPYTS